MSGPAGQSQSVYVGIDVHRKRSQVAVVTEDGTVQLNKNVVNGSTPFLQLIGDLPAGTPVAFEAAFGWGWLVRLLEDSGFEAHMVHPLQCKAIASARLKNDKADAATLAQLLRADLLPEAWIAPAHVRQLRALLRHRAGLVRLRTQLGNRIHAVVAGFGYDRSGSYLSGPGRGWLAGLELPAVSGEIVTDGLAFIGASSAGAHGQREARSSDRRGQESDAAHDKLLDEERLFIEERFRLRAQHAQAEQIQAARSGILEARVRQFHERALRRCATYRRALVRHHPDGAMVTLLELLPFGLPDWLNVPALHGPIVVIGDDSAPASQATRAPKGSIETDIDRG